MFIGEVASSESDEFVLLHQAANPGYVSRTVKPDVNSLWIAEQTSRSSLGQKRKWPFIIAKVKRGIIGADFLRKFQLLIDLHNRKLIDGVTNLSIKGEVATVQEINDLSTVNRSFKYFNLLNSYPDLTKTNLVNRVVKQGVKHHIITTGQPVYSKARQLAPDKLKLAKQEFQFMLDNDIIRPSKSQWTSPFHLVNKKDGTLKPCGDYRRLNVQTVPDRYPIARIEDFNYNLKDNFFSKIYLVKAYYQIPIAEKDKEKTAITTPFGLYKFNTMNFGQNPSTFQRFITEVLYGLEFVFPYLDDVLVDSSTEEEHSEHLKMKVLAHCQKKFKLSRITSYLRDAAKTQAPLLELLKGAKKKDHRKVHWTDDTRRSFEKCKTDPAEAALLSFPRSGLPLSLCTDASDFAVGAVHQQLENEDALSRIESISETNFDAIAEEQTRDEELQHNYILHNNSLKFKPSTLPSGKKLWCDISTPKIRPYIPQKFRFQMFQLIHDLGHPGIKSTVKLMTEKTLKVAIKVHNNIRWTESLPTVLLGLRAVIRPDISYTIAQMVYGTSIKLPGEFFDSPTIKMDPQNFVAKLQQHMAELKPLKSPSNRKQNIFVHKDLKSCSHVFIRIDRVKKALEPLYEGPYAVQKNKLKPAYLLAVDNQNEQASVGQKNETSNLKELSPLPDEQPTTSCGRKIKKPVRFKE
ncbi:hypothetical protein TNCV_3575251 [Trichonephila clavipes]|nr:hypothetical protein TNCV_3575251 [Trichonephila clavipes]